MSDFKATRYPNETFMLEDKEHVSWFYVLLGHDVCRDYYFAETVQ